ncbi:M48 family metalloprotease [Rhizobium sp. ZPR3]|uniref:M48 family metalloprotease n=2 Tax=unclassified Rhizobium TaxID=2613769 RepID=A0AAU7SEQ3_9HYPH
MSDVRVNLHNLRNSSIPTWLGLVLGTWGGLIWGSLISSPIGVGVGVAALSGFGGFIAVPLWGTFWGLIGLGSQRDRAVRQGVTLLKEDEPLAQRVHALAAQLGLKTKPWVGTMPYNNAFAIGANADNAMVVIGQPLIDTLDAAEIDAIIGHELGHIANNDMRRMGLARSFQNSLVWYVRFSQTLETWARWILTWMSELAILRLSRKREYWADAIGAALTSKEHMISALEKLHNGPAISGFEHDNARIMVRGRALGSMLSTHPTLEERRIALQSERFLKRIPVHAPRSLPPQVPGVLPKAEDIAYAKR